MATGIKPQDVSTSSPTNPLKVKDNRVVSPTLGGSGSVVKAPDLGAFHQGVGKQSVSNKF